MKEDHNIKRNDDIKKEDINNDANHERIKETKDKENVQNINIHKKGKKRRKRNKTRALEVIRKKKAQEKKEKNNQNDNKVNEESEGSIEIKKNTYEECQINNTKEDIIIKKEDSQINNDLDKVIIIKEKDNEGLIDNYLVANLMPKENLKQYFQRMLEYYKIERYKNNYYLYDLAINDYFPIKTEFNFTIDFDNYPFISNMFQFLNEQLEPVKDTNNHEVYKEYQGKQSFGFLILDNIEYFYVFNNKYNKELLNDINRVKEYEYENAFIGNSSSIYPNKSGYDYFHDIKSNFLSSNNFEEEINSFFRNYDLKELPNYFFRLHKKNKLPKASGNNNSITMNYAESHYFSSFIEINGAFAYNKSSPMTIIEENNKLFKVSKTINVSSWGRKIDIEENNNNNFIFNKNSVILLEDKMSFPKMLKDLKRNQEMNKNELYSSLNFLIYKSIRKI